MQLAHNLYENFRILYSSYSYHFSFCRINTRTGWPIKTFQTGVLNKGDENKYTQKTLILTHSLSYLTYLVLLLDRSHDGKLREKVDAGDVAV